MSALSGLAKIRAALWQIERDLGLEKLSHSERDVLYAFHAVTAPDRMAITPDRVQDADRVAGICNVEFAEALTRLTELGYLENTDGDAYRITDLPRPA
ncbi:MarR family transcriptional regulator [Citreicella sp. C3M06]|uniref:MarR family transcriptional regulator n=1 Tax=Citreicella sp. C3M06 TaxID=2841564 RepID=UPI001C094A20|nr:MarR family transcriptional regulator [Citreicella sp. C3M06]MBU2961698.1 MarR family transcriptional regulator [Citreicella sp. C3M06]